MIFRAIMPAVWQRSKAAPLQALGVLPRGCVTEAFWWRSQLAVLIAFEKV